jgi:hypothetical protein
MVRARSNPDRPHLQPVSHAAFSVVGDGAVGKIIREVIAWIANRSGERIPPDAFDGAAFETGLGAVAPAFAASATVAGRRIWAARLSDPDKLVPKRTWHTEVVVAGTATGADVVVRLSQLSATPDLDFKPTVPGCVRQIVDSCDVRADGWRLLARATPIESDLAVFDGFREVLLNPARRLPILAVSPKRGGGWAIDPDRLAAQLMGTAHVVALTEEATWALTMHHGRQWSIFWGAGRVYWPSDRPLQDDPYRHPIWFPAEEATSAHDEANAWAGEFLDEALWRTRLGLELPRAEDVRRQASAAVTNAAHEDRVAAARASAKQSEMVGELEAQVAQLKGRIDELEQELADETGAQMDLLQEAETRLLNANATVKKRDDELARTQSILKRARDTLLKNKLPFDRPLDSFARFEDWANETMAPRVVFTARALHDVVDCPDAHREHVEFALLSLRDLYPQGLKDIQSRFKSRALELSKCFANANDYKNFNGYEATFEGAKYVLDWHVKYGQSYDLREAFRIYFAHDKKTDRIIVGHMPKHLDNKLTS